MSNPIRTELKKPIVFFDIESTGVDVAKDRIVSLYMRKDLCSIGGVRQVWKHLINPGILIPPEATKVHGITDEMVKDCPTFKDVAAEFYNFLIGADIAGFNLINFDVPMLWEEFNRAGIDWSLAGVHIVDAGNIFKKKEERTLSAAMKFYCGKDHDQAHDASGDVEATSEVLSAQLGRYADLGQMDIKALAEFSAFDKRIDLAGKIVRNESGVPVYSFGKSKGTPVMDNQGFAHWMLGQDFSSQTKTVVRSILLGQLV